MQCWCQCLRKRWWVIMMAWWQGDKVTSWQDNKMIRWHMMTRWQVNTNRHLGHIRNDICSTRYRCHVVTWTTILNKIDKMPSRRGLTRAKKTSRQQLIAKMVVVFCLFLILGHGREPSVHASCVYLFLYSSTLLAAPFYFSWTAPVNWKVGNAVKKNACSHLTTWMYELNVNEYRIPCLCHHSISGAAHARKYEHASISYTIG